VLDLIGNVWEWTGSVLAAYPGGTVRSDGEQFRVIRGGAYNSTRETASSSYRGYQRPTSATPRADYAGTGFRCAASLPVATPR
jgi:formylglycine-generating enzyme required for sulfatase activity